MSSKLNSKSVVGATALIICLNGEIVARDDVISIDDVNTSRHLGIIGRVNLGSFYTPAKYVRIAAEWLLKHKVSDKWTIADLSCGYGAFFELQFVEGLRDCRFVGNDIDHKAIEKTREYFPFVECHERNALFGVSRQAFGIGNDEKLVIVGNPPYNDVTSQINQGIKDAAVSMDVDVKTRDLGMSSLLVYDKLKADYVLVLHPLSYLVKKANFQAARNFFKNYSLIEHIVFSSQEFAGTSKTAGFPVVVAMYKREEYKGLTYRDVIETKFTTTDGVSFSLSGFDYVTDEIGKYPNSKHRYSPEILFYTMRDINALRRSKTFIPERCANAVDVDPDKLAYYCYVDCFKRYADVPYYMGNFNVPYIKDEFGVVSNDVVAIAKSNNPAVFGEQPKPTDEMVARVKSYIERSVKGRE